MQGLSALAGIRVAVGGSVDVDTEAVWDGVGVNVSTNIGTEGAQADKLKEKTIAIFNSQTFFIFIS